MEELVYKPSELWATKSQYCSGCMHPLVGKVILDLIDEMGIDPMKTCFLTAPGCVGISAMCTNINANLGGLGRGAAMATGLKRTNPDNFVFCWDGDGADADIGLGDVVHAAARGENITIIMVNNSVFANTGGQMASTTLLGQKSATSPYGRRENIEGYPIRVPEMLATLDGCTYAARVAVYDPAHYHAAKKVLKKAFENQLNKNGFSFVEFLSNCPTSWRMDPLDTIDYIKNVTEKTFPIGVFKDVELDPDKRRA